MVGETGPGVQAAGSALHGFSPACTGQTRASGLVSSMRQQSCSQGTAGGALTLLCSQLTPRALTPCLVLQTSLGCEGQGHGHADVQQVMRKPHTHTASLPCGQRTGQGARMMRRCMRIPLPPSPSPGSRMGQHYMRPAAVTSRHQPQLLPQLLSSQRRAQVLAWQRKLQARAQTHSPSQRRQRVPRAGLLPHRVTALLLSVQAVRDLHPR